nr:hypothetical protein [Tanacetum cinerariifolium]
YDSECDEINSAKIALIANLSHYGSDNLAESFGNSEEPNLSTSTTIVEVPKDLPKVSIVNSSLKKLKFHLASFDMVVKERTTATAITEGTWGLECLIVRAVWEFFVELLWIVVQDKMSRDVITVGSTMRIPLLYRGEYLQWRERFMNYLEDKTDGEAMINSIQNGDQSLPVIAQVNKSAKDLWDALERQMRGSEYGEQDRKASANKKQEFVKTDDKKVEKKANKKKRDTSKVKCYNCKKEGHFAKDCKKANVKDYNYYKTKMLLAKKDSDEQVLLAEDQAWMESSSDSDQEINANMVFMVQIEKVLSESDESSSSAEETTAEVAYYTFESESESEFKTLEYYDNFTNYGLFVNNDDDQEIFHDAIESASENFIENHIDSQKVYKKSEVDHNDSEEKEHLVDKLIRKFNHKIAKKIIIDLEDEAVNLLEKEKANLKTIESLKSKGFESSKTVISESKNQNENDCLVVEKECDKVENLKVNALGMFKLSVLQSVSPILMTKTSCESNNVEIKLKRKRRKIKSSKQNVKQVNNDVSRANSDFVHFLDLDTFSSVRRPKHCGVIWKKKGSSNTSNIDLSAVSHSKLNKNVKRYSRKDLLACNNSHLGETSSAYVCNDAMNVSCNPRMCDLLDDNNFFIFDDESVRISPVSKMPFKKKPYDSMNVHSKRCSKHMMGNRALLTNFVEKFLRTVRFGNNDFAVIAGYGDVVIRSMMIKKVYYVEGLGHNLFSVGQFCDKGLEVAFRKSTCFVRNEDGLPKMKFEKDHLCSACKQGKIYRKHHKSKTAFASNKPLYLLHMGLYGPMRVASINEKRYVLVVVDDYSRYTWVFFLHSKDEDADVIISFINKTQVNLQLQVQRVRTDNGTEFKNKTLAKFFDEVGITQHFSAARTPQQNGVVERRNRTLVEAARTKLTFANLQSFLWAEAIATACFTQNRSIIHKSFDKTPYELMNNKKPNIKFFCVFGCTCYLPNDYEDVGKLKKRGILYLEPGLSKLNKTRKSSNQSVSKVSETSKKDLEDLFHNFYDEYFDSSKILKSSTTNVETSINEEVFHEVSESFQGESSSSSLNDDVQISQEEVILPQKNTQSISNNMIPNVDEASTSYNVFNERLEDAYFDAIPTPMVKQAKLKHDIVGKLVDHIDYRSMIGSLMYVTSSRPDIMFATIILAYGDEATERIKSLSGNLKEEKIKRELEEIETINIELDHRVTKLVAENEHLKQTYKQLYDSIKSLRVRSKEQCDALIKKVNIKSAENSNLNASLQKKVLVIQTLKDTLSKLKGKAIVNEAIPLHPIDQELLKINVAPLAPKLQNNRTTHYDYVKHTQEETATLREIVENERFLNPLNTSLDYAYRIQQTQSKAKKNKLEEHHRNVRSSFHNKKSVVNIKAISSVPNSKLNVNSDLKCATCNGCLFSDNHDSCVLEFINSVNAHVKSKSAKKPMNSKIRKPTGKLINLVQKFLGTAKFRNDHVAKIIDYGDYKIRNVTISRVYFVEGLGHNLFFVRQFYDSDREVGISYETSVARSPQQNGVVKRRNCTLIEAARTMLIYAQASLFLWAEAVATACYTQNRSIIRLCREKTPYELLHNKLPDLSFLHVFGSLCYPTNDSENLGKLQPKADIGIFIGYAPTKKAFRIYNRRTRQIVETIHVDFDELTAMASEQSSSGPALNEMTPTTISSGLVPKPSSSTPYVPPSRND